MPPLDAPDAAPATHQTTTTERGSFALARCSCGWSGPARRSRERARADARGHAPSPDHLTAGSG
ncbi:hypothetical protein ACFVIM_33115 [Streptomyces sp. NPDC057638]|uniref:hypothetical protein n=1 Tax=Streptomyces sp. NPDC057638 TaxID=3346190 RepID=UPI0036779C6D